MSEIVNWTSYIPHAFETRKPLPPSLNYHGVLAYLLTRDLMKQMPELKEIVSPWHVIMRDILLVPIVPKVDVHTFDEAGWKEFFGSRYKGSIRYTNIIFLILLIEK